MNILHEESGLRACEESGYPFLIVEISGLLSFDQYKNLLSSTALQNLTGTGKFTRVLLELNGLWSVGTEGQEWTARTCTIALQERGVTKMAVCLAAHVFPMFSMMAGAFEKNAAIPLKYFGDLQEAADWLVA